MTSTAPALTVGHVMRSTALQLTAMTGERGLDRKVTWAHVSELEDPTPWLLGGEILMTTGIAVPRTGARQRAYVERLDDAGVAALALSEQLHVPPLRAEFLDAALERGLPVLWVPLSVPFIAISQEVAAAVQSDMHRRLTAQLHVFGALRTLAAENLTVTELFARLEQLSGYSLSLCTRQRRPLLQGVPVPPAELVEQLPPSYDAAPTIPGGYAIPVPAPGGPAGFLVAIEQPGVIPSGLGVAQHIATVAALQLSIARHEHETARREGAETLADLLRGDLDDATARRRLRRLGHDVDAGFRLVVVRGLAQPMDDRPVVQALADTGEPHLLLRQKSDFVALVPAHVELDGRLARRAGVAVGASRAFDSASRLDVPRREAMWAAARAADAGGGLIVFGDDAAGRWLMEDQAALRELVRRVLGEVIAYDEAHGGTLLPSVRAWLEHDRHTQAAARSLMVHANTLTYRIRRFERLSGRSLQATGDLAEVWLALQAVPHLQPLDGPAALPLHPGPGRPEPVS